MPVMLDNAGMQQWLDHDLDTEKLTALFEPVLVAPQVITPVDQAINNSRNKIAPQPVGDSKTIR